MTFSHEYSRFKNIIRINIWKENEDFWKIFGRNSHHVVCKVQINIFIYNDRIVLQKLMHKSSTLFKLVFSMKICFSKKIIKKEKLTKPIINFFSN